MCFRAEFEVNWANEIISILNRDLDSVSHACLMFHAGIYDIETDNSDITAVHAMHNARYACQRAIDTRMNSVVTLTKEIADQISTRMELVGHAQQALENDEFKLHLQLMVNASTKNIILLKLRRIL